MSEDSGQKQCELLQAVSTRAYGKWTPAEDRKLVQLHAGGHEIAAIARALGRTKGAVRSRLKHHDLETRRRERGQPR